MCGLITDKCLGFQSCPPEGILSGPQPFEPPPAFAGATGYGRFAWADAPTEIPEFHVTTLADYDPTQYYPTTETPVPTNLHGTLRYIIDFEIGCLGIDPEDQGDCFKGDIPPRSGIIIFDVTGEINLVTQLDLRGQYVWMDGSTAPYSQNYPQGGITITGSQFTIKNSHHIVLRYLRFRSGRSTNGKFHCARSLAIGGEQVTTHSVIIDHCSIGASQDDNFSFYGPICHVTVQNCIIGGGAYNACKAGIGSGGTDSFAADEGITFCHNLIAGTFMRQMLFGGPERVDFYNNVVGNSVWQTELVSGNGSDGPRMNILYNWYRSSRDYVPEWGDFTGNPQQPLRYSDPIRAVPTTQPCAAPCGELYVPDNHETVHLDGNLYERWDLYASPQGWTRPYSVNNQWDLTWAIDPRSGSMTLNFDGDLQRETAWDMWESTDYKDHDPEGEISYEDIMDDVFDDVVTSSGCRLPTSQPALDTEDQGIVASINSGIWTWPTGHENDLKPAMATDPAPANSLQPLVEPFETELQWKQNDSEVEYFAVYLKKGQITSEVPVLIGHVAPIGSGQFVSIEVPSEYLVEGLLEEGEVYYWRVDSINGCAGDPNVGPTVGPVWAFRVKDE